MTISIVVKYVYVKHGICVQYAGVSIAVYGRLQHLTKTCSGPLMAWTQASKVVGSGHKIRVEIDTYEVYYWLTLRL